MYHKYRIVESIGGSVSQYKSYRDQVYRYTPNQYICRSQFCVICFTILYLLIFSDW